MNDIRMIREKPDLMREALVKRQMDPAPIDRILALDEERRAKLSELEALRAQRNSASKEIGRMQDESGRETIKDRVRAINIQIDGLDTLVSELDAQLQEALYELPNVPDPDVPPGKDDSENVVLKTVGALREFAFTPLPHYELGPKLGYLDFERGVKLAGTRFYVTSGPIAKLQRGLIQWLLDHHIARGYREFGLPFMVKQDVMLAAGQLPKFRENLYHDVERDAWFVPTAEVPLTGLHMGDILDGEQLTLNYTAYTPCFRKENLAAGKDTRGIKRGFQFDKVEMYKYCKPEDSEQELQNMFADIEDILHLLKIPYRVKQLCTGDLGFGSTKTYDLEVWAPGIGEWLEVSSASNVRDFQARRGNIRFRRSPGAKPEFVHTLNGSGLGIPRTMIAILENYQQEDNSIQVPDVLRDYVRLDAIN
ncbi:MAG: serine--tRNA ligase [Anaerolineae bacterium]|nr:serine--tRNA ligase [Anaerolineae bacterium]